jgi:organic radical activating enzyme
LARTGRLKVADLFRDTVQGEGPSIGRRAAFIRMSGCNLTCSWCDTPYTWDTTRYDLGRESSWRTVDDLVAWALEGSEPLVVLTGGEPLLQSASGELAERLCAAGRSVEFETNGTRTPPKELVEAGVYWNVSPKLSASGVPKDRRIVPDVLRAFTALDTARFKFVVSSPEELDEIATLQAEFGMAAIWVMPEGTTPEAVRSGLRALAEPAIARGWNLSARLHIELWGDRRGR